MCSSSVQLWPTFRLGLKGDYIQSAFRGLGCQPRALGIFRVWGCKQEVSVEGF